MCGIAGILRIQDPQQGLLPPREAIPEAWLDILDESIKHRGPDGQGRFRDRAIRPDGKVVDVALVHRRLAIIDLSTKAAQPMVIEGLDRAASASSRWSAQEPTPLQPAPDAHGLPALISREGTPYEPIRAHCCPKCNTLTAIAFNGCIYNHKELRKELQALGHEFFTDHSDTEVLVHGWCEWGGELWPRLEGMFAIVIWDSNRGELAYATDVSGEKPMFHARSEPHTANLDIHAYCSTPAGMIRLQQAVPVMTPSPAVGECVRHWFEQDWDLSRALPWGDTLSPNLASHREVCHTSSFDIWELNDRKGAVLDANRAEQLLRESVHSRLEADVPLGVFLSGGVDSSLIAMLAKQHAGEVSTFTVKMPSERFDESELAKIAARSIGSRHTTLDCDPSPAEDLIELITHFGAPFSDSSLLPSHWVSRATRSVAKVAMGGDGGDELFAGYRRHAAAWWLWKHRRRVKLALAMGLVKIGSNVRAKRPGSFADRVGKLMTLLRSSETNPDAFALRDLWDLYGRQGSEPGVGRPVEVPSRFQNLPFHDFEWYLPNDILCKTDTASMAVPLEVRSPFLSRALIQACLSAPLSSLMPHGKRKGLLKQVALKYLPPEIVNRPKQGFAIPIGDWFRSDYGQMRQLLYDHLESAEPFPDLPLELNMDFVRQMLKEHDQAGEKSFNPWHGRDHSQRLYMLLVLSIWCKWLQGLGK